MYQEPLENGSISVEAAAAAPNSSGDGCVGIVCKHIDQDNWIAIRYGAYGAVMALIREGAERRTVLLRSFRCEIGRRYTCEVQVSQGLIAAALDGRTMGVVLDPFKDRSGRPGVYAQSPAEVFRVTIGDEAETEDASEAARALYESGPRVVQESGIWSLEAAEYSVVPLAPGGGRFSACTVALYWRNRSARAARVTDIALDGRPSQALIEEGRMAWWRCRPETVAPGGLCQALVKLSSMALARARLAALGSPVGPYRIGLETADGAAHEVELALSPEPAALRLNFIAFDPDLQTLHVYVAAADELVGRKISRVELNGVDVTSRVRPGVGPGSETGLRPDTLPLRLDLPEPLELAAPTLITVRAEGGAFAGHAVRAFPSRFPVQIVILGKQPGPEEVKELADLCFTEVGFCGARFENLPELKRQGLVYFPYAYPSANQIDRYLGQPQRPELSGWWIDEIDGWKKQPHDAQEMLRAADEAMKERGLPVAPYCMNIMAPWDDVGYIELADALSHEYGIDRGIGGLGGYRAPVDFGNPGDITRRELRIARKPWWPYFRNIEAAVLLDPQTKQMVQHYRPIDPREHRLYVYSCLANGAKGALNWNYGVNYLPAKPGGWLSSTHDAIRLNMTALKEPKAFDVEVPRELLDALRAATHECGRVNAELQLLGPLLTIGDVSDLARVVRSVPEKGVRGGPAAHARAIACGLDAVVLIVVNLNIDSNFNARKPQPVKSYAPVNVEVELTVPPWLQVAEAFEVSCAGVQPLEPVRKQGALQLQFPELDVATAVVVTSDTRLRPRMEGELAALQAKLRSAGVELD